MTEQQLLDLKERVEDAKTQVAELNGQQTALMNQLKNDWGCKTIEEANPTINKWRETACTVKVLEVEEKVIMKYRYYL